MNNEEINRIADLIAKKLFDYMEEKQREFEEQYLVDITYKFSDDTSSTIINEDENLKSELETLEEILKIQIKKENYEEAAITNNRIKQIKNKLNKK